MLHIVIDHNMPLLITRMSPVVLAACFRPIVRHLLLDSALCVDVGLVIVVGLLGLVLCGVGVGSHDFVDDGLLVDLVVALELSSAHDSVVLAVHVVIPLGVVSVAALRCL